MEFLKVMICIAVFVSCVLSIRAAAPEQELTTPSTPAASSELPTQPTISEAPIPAGQVREKKAWYPTVYSELLTQPTISEAPIPAGQVREKKAWYPTVYSYGGFYPYAYSGIYRAAYPYYGPYIF